MLLCTRTMFPSPTIPPWKLRSGAAEADSPSGQPEEGLPSDLHPSTWQSLIGPQSGLPSSLRRPLPFSSGSLPVLPPPSGARVDARLAGASKEPLAPFVGGKGEGKGEGEGGGGEDSPNGHPAFPAGTRCRPHAASRDSASLPLSGTSDKSLFLSTGLRALDFRR